MGLFSLKFLYITLPDAPIQQKFIQRLGELGIVQEQIKIISPKTNKLHEFYLKNLRPYNQPLTVREIMLRTVISGIAIFITTIIVGTIWCYILALYPDNYSLLTSNPIPGIAILGIIFGIGLSRKMLKFIIKKTDYTGVKLPVELSTAEFMLILRLPASIRKEQIEAITKDYPGVKIVSESF